MPASGKSTVSKVIADKLRWGCLDIDEWIIEHEAMPIAKVIENRGQDYVVNLEGQCINENELYETIVSSTGSTIYTQSLPKLRSQTYIVMLDVELRTLMRRLAPDTRNTRGIVGLSDTGLKALFEERMPIYISWADEIINCVNKTPEQLADEIIDTYL